MDSNWLNSNYVFRLYITTSEGNEVIFLSDKDKEAESIGTNKFKTEHVTLVDIAGLSDIVEGGDFSLDKLEFYQYDNNVITDSEITSVLNFKDGFYSTFGMYYIQKGGGKSTKPIPFTNLLSFVGVFEVERYGQMSPKTAITSPEEITRWVVSQSQKKEISSTHLAFYLSEDNLQGDFFKNPTGITGFTGKTSLFYRINSSLHASESYIEPHNLKALVEKPPRKVLV